MRTLLTSLAEHPMAMLRGIAERHGIALTTNVRDEAATQLASGLGEPGAIGAAGVLHGGRADSVGRVACRPRPYEDADIHAQPRGAPADRPGPAGT